MMARVGIRRSRSATVIVMTDQSLVGFLGATFLWCGRVSPSPDLKCGFLLPFSTVVPSFKLFSIRYSGRRRPFPFSPSSLSPGPCSVTNILSPPSPPSFPSSPTCPTLWFLSFQGIFHHFVRVREHILSMHCMHLRGYNFVSLLTPFTSSLFGFPVLSNTSFASFISYFLLIHPFRRLPKPRSSQSTHLAYPQEIERVNVVQAVIQSVQFPSLHRSQFRIQFNRNRSFC